MARQPLLPTSLKDPTGQDRRERGAMRAFSVRMNKIYKLYLNALNDMPVQAVTVNATSYTFDLDAAVLANILTVIGDQVDRILLEGDERNLWFLEAYVAPAVIQGTSQAYTNLSVQSATYAATKPTLQSVLLSPPYVERLRFIQARQFEDMQGLSNQVKTNMGRILSDGVAQGLNPRTVAAQLRKQIGIEQRRAERIARTEVTQALRRARWAETEQAQKDLGLKTKLMHLSALSPTTRPNHRARHSKLYSVQEVKDWYAVDGNAINCKCSQVEVLVDDEGNPLTPGVVDRARAMLFK